MTPKSLISVGLLAFVIASMLYLATGRGGIAGPEPRGPRGTTAAAPAEAPAQETRVVACYFHATVRCPTCLAIERGSREALESEFPNHLQSGSLVWRSVDMERPENAAVVEKLQLASSSLVLLEENGDRVVRWEVLPDVWTLVGDDRRLREYVTEHTRAWLEKI